MIDHTSAHTFFSPWEMLGEFDSCAGLSEKGLIDLNIWS